MSQLGRVDDTRPEIDDMREEWKPITALLGGTLEMRKAGTTYLPQNPAEAPEAYKFRLSISTLFNGFKKTVETMSGKPFSEPLKFSDNVPDAIKEYCDNIDLEGRNLQAFLHEVFATALARGLSHILVDYPQSAPAKTVAEQRASGARPYFVHIRPTDVLSWRSERINGAETLTQFRFQETVVEDDGEWDVDVITQIRVLTPGGYEIWRQRQADNGQLEWYQFEVGTTSLGVIPLATVYTGRESFMVACPPLMDLAELNIEHWRSSSEQANIMHVARVPILFGAGFDEDTTITIGTQKAVSSANPDAKLAFVEHTGAAIEAGRMSIQDIEDRMRVLGAQLLVKTPAGNRTTATEKSIDSAEADSALSLMALNLQDSANQALQFMAQWEKLPTGGEIAIYRDFDDVSNDTAMGDLLMKAKGEGVVSAQTTFEELQMLGVVSEGRDWGTELERMRKEGPTGAVIGNFEQPPSAPAPNVGA